MKFALSERCVAEKVFWFAGSLKSGVESIVVLPIKSDVLESEVDEIAYAVGFAGGQYVVFRGGLLENAPHGIDEFGCVSPVAMCIDISEY